MYPLLNKATYFESRDYNKLMGYYTLQTILPNSDLGIQIVMSV